MTLKKKKKELVLNGGGGTKVLYRWRTTNKYRTEEKDTKITILQLP